MEEIYTVMESDGKKNQVSIGLIRTVYLLQLKNFCFMIFDDKKDFLGTSLIFQLIFLSFKIKTQ